MTLVHTNAILISISLLMLSVSSYIVWPSRWNIPAHLQLGFSLLAYVIPVFFTDILYKFPPQIVSFYAWILVLGSMAYLIGLIVGFHFPLVRIVPFQYTLDLPTTQIEKHVSSKVFWLLVVAVVGVAVSYAIMGFVPMFAEEPLMAKFFRGPYQESYRKVAVLYRFSMYVMYALIPVSLAIWVRKRQFRFFVLTLVALVEILLSLVRGPVAYGLLLFVGLLAARSTVGFFIYIFIVILIYPLGSVFYYILGVLLSLDAYKMLYIVDNFWEFIVSGAPDIYDHLKFLEAFIDHGSFTYGLTFIGGLVPFNFKWNPAVWALSITNPDTPVKEIASGGYRLPAPLWGYTAYGWLGVLIVPFLSGFFWGNATRFAKKYVQKSRSIIHASIALTVYLTIGVQLSKFYLLTLYSLPGIITSLVLLWRINLLKSNKFNE